MDLSSSVGLLGQVGCNPLRSIDPGHLLTWPNQNSHQPKTNSCVDSRGVSFWGPPFESPRCFLQGSISVLLLRARSFSCGGSCHFPKGSISEATGEGTAKWLENTPMKKKEDNDKRPPLLSRAETLDVSKTTCCCKRIL